MGLLVVIDGTDGSGKTTQIKLILKATQQQGLKAAEIVFPGYATTFAGSDIKAYLQGEFGPLKYTHPRVISYLYAVDRFEQQQRLLTLLQENDLVIAGRYVPSNVAYQAAKLPIKQRQDFRQWCEALDYKVLGNRREDAVIFISLPPRLSGALITQRNKRQKPERDIHEENLKYMEQVWQEYHHYYKLTPTAI